MASFPRSVSTGFARLSGPSEEGSTRGVRYRMSSPVSSYLGLDIGTSVTKAAVFDSRGREIAIASSRTEVARPRAAWSEMDPEAAWRAVCAACREAVASSGVGPAYIADSRAPQAGKTDRRCSPALNQGTRKSRVFDVRELISWDKEPIIDADGTVTGYRDRMAITPSHRLKPGAAATVKSFTTKSAPYADGC